MLKLIDTIFKCWQAAKVTLFSMRWLGDHTSAWQFLKAGIIFSIFKVGTSTAAFGITKVHEWIQSFTESRLVDADISDVTVIYEPISHANAWFPVTELFALLSAFCGILTLALAVKVTLFVFKKLPSSRD